MDRIGIIAGEGYLPRLVAGAAQNEGLKVYPVAINKQAYKDLDGKYTDCAIYPLTKLSDVTQFLHANSVQYFVAIGKIHKLDLISQIPFADQLAWKYIKQLVNFEDNTFHRMIEECITELGLELLPQSRFLKEHFAPIGLYSHRELTDNEILDLDYGKDMAEKASALEVSQTIVVKDQAVMAFEAAEGTDQTIIRGCKYAKNNAVIVKIPWETQSPYFDLPTIGPRTIKRIAENKGSVLAIKAGSTFVVEMDKCIELANKYNISFLGF